MRRFIPVLILAFIVGGMFRFGNQYDIPVIRMFATQGIVIIGLLAANAVKKLQMDEGMRKVKEELEKLPSGVRVQQTLWFKGRPVWLIEAGDEKLVMAGSDVPQSASVRRAARAVFRQSQELWAEAIDKGWVKPGERVKTALVFLRRRLSEPALAVEPLEPDVPMALVNPEGIKRWINTRPPITA